MADNDDQSHSDNLFYMRQLKERSCAALDIDNDSNSWFDIVDKVEAQANVLLDTQHELALLMDKHRPTVWCCDFARKTRGWNHDSGCPNFVMCL